MTTAPNQEAGSRFATRRRSPRYPFIGKIWASDPISDRELLAQTSLLSSGGCYIETATPFDAWTIIRSVIKSDGRQFKSWAVVVYSDPGKGMGIAFLSPPNDQKTVLQEWMAQLAVTTGS